jgi:hypothetical protein
MSKLSRNEGHGSHLGLCNTIMHKFSQRETEGSILLWDIYLFIYFRVC